MRGAEKASGRAIAAVRGNGGRTALAALALASTLGFAGLLSGCASWCPPRKEVAAAQPGRAPADVAPDSLARRGFSGEVDDCACTLEHRINLCVTVNGAGGLSDDFRDLSFARVREGGAADTLSVADVAAGARCFGEWPGVQRVFMLRTAVGVDSTGWFEVPTVDCCHGEAKTIDFAN